jgi:hypothetical protein
LGFAGQSFLSSFRKETYGGICKRRKITLAGQLLQIVRSYPTLTATLRDKIAIIINKILIFPEVVVKNTTP